jgi:dTDP-4-amino-4,6-dideoxygalactose transaminase
MAKKKPNHADAELVLRLYDLRREPVMRESRKTIAAWLPRSLDDVLAIAKLDDPRNAAWRQVSSYFEMAYGFARHGIVPPDFLAENTGEGLLLYAKLQPYLKAFRKHLAPTAFRNAEWLVRKSSSARERVKLFEKRIAAQLAAQAEKG